jgi:hypothetical protein
MKTILFNVRVFDRFSKLEEILLNSFWINNRLLVILILLQTLAYLIIAFVVIRNN